MGYGIPCLSKCAQLARRLRYRVPGGETRKYRSPQSNNSQQAVWTMARARVDGVTRGGFAGRYYGGSSTRGAIRFEFTPI